MRVAVKWIQVLEDNYTNIFNRKEPFRQQDGTKIFLTFKELEALSENLKIQKKIVNGKLKEIMNNNSQLQAEMAKDKTFQKIAYFS